MLPFVLMAQLNSEKSSQGYCSPSKFGIIGQCLSGFLIHLFTDKFQQTALKNACTWAWVGSSKNDFMQKPGCMSQIVLRLESLISRGRTGGQNFAKLAVSGRPAKRTYVFVNVDRGCLGGFCCEGFNRAACGVLEV